MQPSCRTAAQLVYSVLAAPAEVVTTLEAKFPAVRCGRDPGQLEHAELLVVSGDLALALADLDLHPGLVVVGRGEDLRPLGRIVVFRSISLVKMPPLVSMPSDSGVTSSSRTSLTALVTELADPEVRRG